MWGTRSSRVASPCACTIVAAALGIFGTTQPRGTSSHTLHTPAGTHLLRRASNLLLPGTRTQPTLTSQQLVRTDVDDQVARAVAAHFAPKAVPRASPPPASPPPKQQQQQQQQASAAPAQQLLAAAAALAGESDVEASGTAARGGGGGDADEIRGGRVRWVARPGAPQRCGCVVRCAAPGLDL